MSRTASRLAADGRQSGGVTGDWVELGLATATAGNIDERHTAHKAQLGNMLEQIETAPTEEVAMEIMALRRGSRRAIRRRPC